MMAVGVIFPKSSADLRALMVEQILQPGPLSLNCSVGESELLGLNLTAQLDEKSNLGLRCPRADVVRVVDALLLVSAAPTLLWWMASIRMSRHATFRRVYEDVSQRRDRTCPFLGKR